MEIPADVTIDSKSVFSFVAGVFREYRTWNEQITVIKAEKLNV